jgi:diadenosine tetraphosphate (Ap4A) HIT family hydrolase
MPVERLWAAWRAEYVSSVGTGPPEPPAGDGAPSVSGALGAGSATVAGCVFCAILAGGSSDEEAHIVWSSDLIVAILNAYPYASGHLLVMPRRHVRELEELTDPERGGLWDAVHDAVAAVKRGYGPDGVNLGVNLGRAAGAGIPGHLHVHVVPRWTGDTNFMTSAAEVRVLPEALSVSWQRLRTAWDA